jgi:DNA-binding MarR family transcriptional regulator
MSSEPKLPPYLMADMGAVLNWLAGIIPQLYTQALAELSIDGRHLAILLTLQNKGAQVQAHLSTLTRIDKATMVSLLNDLEQRNCIERRQHPTDRRAYAVYLTEAGRSLIDAAYKQTTQATNRLLGSLNAAEREKLHEMLVRVAEDVTPQTFMLGDDLD